MKTLKYSLTTLVLSFLLISLSTAQGRFGLTYNTSLPLGSTADFTSAFSFRGVGLEGRWQMTENGIYLGVNGAWSTFYESEYGTFNTHDTRSTTGTQYRYQNVVPIMVSGYKYFNASETITLYAGLGLGTIYYEQRKDFGLWMVVNDGWQFALAPEIGVLVPAGIGDILLSVKYNMGFETSSMPAFSSLGINLGFLF